MRRLRTALYFLLSLRHYPDTRVRRAWWTVALMALLLCLIGPTTRSILFGLWIIGNFSYAFAAIIWGFFHPRIILSARAAGLRWAVWLTLLCALIFFSSLYDASQQVQGLFAMGSSYTTTIVFLITLVFCPLIFLSIAAIGLIGAAVGGFAMRHTGQMAESARAMVRVAYGALLLYSVATPFSARYPFALLFLVCSIPLLTVGFYRLPIRLMLPVSLKGRRILTRLEQSLVLKWGRAERTRALDLRGAALGLLAGLVILIIPTSVMAPLKTLGLVTLIQSRSALTSFTSLLGKPIEYRLAADREHIALVTLDPTARYLALQPSVTALKTPSTGAQEQTLQSILQKPKPGETSDLRQIDSESGLQAALIRKLHRWGAARIVLPAPTLREHDFLVSPGSPTPDQGEIDRSRSEARELSRAMQEAGNVILTLPQDRRTWMSDLPPNPRDKNRSPLTQDRRFVLLSHAASAVSLSYLVNSKTTRLPMIPVNWQGYPPLPVLLCAAEKGHTALLHPTEHDFDLSHMLGFHLPQVAPEGVLVNFVGRDPQHDFMHLTYSALLREEPIYLEDRSSEAISDQRPGRWVSPASYFRGRIVFLGSLSGLPRATPVGLMTQEEMLAYATATLLSGDAIRRFNPISAVFWSLLIALVVGVLCFRREPMDAVWRVSIPIFLVTALSLVLFLFLDVWYDPVQPLAGALAALAFTTQATYQEERAERQRTRALFQRFVAPGMVDEWLSRPTETLGLGGVRRSICVLFADVRNFTHFAEFHEADKVVEVINAYMSAMTRALHDYGGVLDKYTGDGLMAWFPVEADPGQQEKTRQDIAQAVRAALALRDAALDVSRRMPPDEQLRLGIGLHYGDAVVGLVGCAELQVNFTALGHTVVVSARLQTIADGGEVVISEQVFEAIADRFQVIESEPVHVKGISHLVRPYRVTCERKSSDSSPLLSIDPAHAALISSQLREERSTEKIKLEEGAP